RHSVGAARSCPGSSCRPHPAVGVCASTPDIGNGFAGLCIGWFRLHNGEKALIYLTTRRHVVYRPTFDGYTLLLSVEAPSGFIDTLKQYAP
ncbi:PH domain-containing protein, partial [Candidatus Entotheonella palauensis]|uniref:PH domain-containing protein n=1 Tax=Candidatus Entotheonella palauensis TaxID=93172 RepID=UPI001C4E121E